MSNSLTISRLTGDRYAVDAKFDGLDEGVAEGINFSELPTASQEVIIRIGLTNILRDSMAGKASDPAEARQALVDKIKRVLEGDVSGGTRGPRKTEEERERRAFIEGVLRAKGVKLTGKELTEAIEAVYAKNKTAVDKEVAKRIAAKAKTELDLDI